MPTINQLPLITQLSFGDNLVVWAPNQGDSRRASITTFVQFIETGFTNVVCQTVQTTPVSFAQLQAQSALALALEPSSMTQTPTPMAIRQLVVDRMLFPYGATALLGILADAHKGFAPRTRWRGRL